MKKICVLSDFDGTITSKDAIYDFLLAFADDDWEEVERLWLKKGIGSKECLTREFSLVPDLSEKLIDEFIETVEIDETFRDFHNFALENDIDIYIVSDGLDYFINKILEKHNIKGLNIISNHGEFEDETFKITFPNSCSDCTNLSGTCKCNVVKQMKQKYEKVIYIGDGTSDFCVADKADFLFAKSTLNKYCEEKNIQHLKFNNFKEIMDNILVNHC